MTKRNIIVIGASAGGFEAVQVLVGGLPPDLDAAVFIVWHMGADAAGILPAMLNKLHTLPASQAVDREPVRYGRIYVAAPDHHLLLEKDHIRITHGPKENRFRPAVDPLFRSAAFTYGKRVIGIVLSGALDDGTAGLWTIKNYGGIAVVQDPEDARVSSMPEHAIKAVAVDYRLPVARMGDLLVKLCTEVTATEEDKDLDMDNNKKTAAEVRIALQEQVTGEEMLELGELSPYTCPECHGILLTLKEGGRIRFRCHTGHAFSTDSLLSAISESIEENLWSTVRSVEESVLLLNHMGDHFAESNQPKLAAGYFRKAQESKERMQQIRQILLKHEHLNQEMIREENENL